jgi:hypothetical protein
MHLECLRIKKSIFEIRRLFLKLVIKEPWIEIQHQACVSSIIWEIPHQCVVVSYLPFSSSSWTHSALKELKENSQLPSLAPRLTGGLLLIERNEFFRLLITPAVYLLFGVFCTFFSAFRLKRIELPLFAFPGIIQTIVIILASVSSEFRYQYGIILIGQFSLGLLVLSLCTPKLRQPGLKNIPPYNF